MASLTDEGSSGEDSTGGALQRLRAAGDALTAPFAQPRVALTLEIVLVVAWFVLRSLVPADSALLVAWAVATAVVMLLSPVSGLVVLAATAPFDEPFTVTALLGLRMVLVLVLGLAVAVRVIARPRSMPWSWPLLLGAALLVGTLASLVFTYRRFGRGFALDSLEFWIGGVGAAMVVLLCAAWIARHGDRRPLVVAVVATSLAAYVTILDHLAPQALAGTPLAWLVHAKDFGPRISGVIPSPNGVAALVLPPAMLLAAAVVVGPRGAWRLRGAAAIGLLPMIPVLYFTYSRTVYLAVFAFLVIVAWRFRRLLGVAVLTAGLVAGVVMFPSYLALRESQVGLESTRTGSILVASDILRFKAWNAAGQMFMARPVTGWGYRSYREIGNRYGDEALNSPHNEWLRFFAEQGIVGGLVGLALIVTGTARLARIPGWIGTGLLSGFAAFAIAASFNNPLLFVQISIIVFTLFGTGVAWRPGMWSTAGVAEPIDQAASASADDDAAPAEDSVTGAASPA